jgi:hypothetical protein
VDGRKLSNDRYSVTRITAILLGTFLVSQIALSVQDNLPFDRDNTSQLSTGLAFAQIDIEDDINPSIPDNPSVSILSIASRYDADLGSFQIIGELVNNVDSQVKNIQLNVTFYDAEGGVLGAATGSPYIESLRPQERSAFDIAIYGDAATKVSGFSYYRISKSWDAVQESRPGLLDFDLRDITVDTCGYYHFLGVVTNYGKVPAGGIILSAAFYNDKNQITESALTSVTGIDGILPSTQQGSIELLVDERMMSQFSYYSFNVQSVEYTSTVLEETNDPESADYLDYQNGSPVLTASISQNSSGPPAWTNNIMTVSTNLASYEIGSNDLVISGMVPRQDGVHWDNGAGDFVLVKLMTASGSVLDKTAPPMSQDGSFSATLPFLAEEGSEGQVYRIRAEFKGTIAENNFIVSTGQDGRDDSLRSGCKPEYIVINQLGWIPGDEVINGDGIGNSTIGYYPEKPQLDVGSLAMLSVSAENKLNRVQPITAVIQVFDADGTVVFIHLNQSMLFPDSKYQIRVPWTPDIKGQYTIESFVISGLDEPRVLSRSLRTTLNVV